MVAPVESRFWGMDDGMGYWREPFIWLAWMALGSMKLEGSYMPFWDGWKSMARDHHGGGGRGRSDEGEERRSERLVWVRVKRGSARARGHSIDL